MNWGINNDEYAEILSGLQEGEQVVLPTLASGSGQSSTQLRSGMGMFGAMGAASSGGGNARSMQGR